MRGNFQWYEPLLQSGTLPATFKQPNRIITEALVKYVRTFRGLEFASDQSIATFLYDDMGFIRLSPLKVTNSVRRKAALGAGEFPPLAECREKWETKFGGRWDWQNPEITEWQPAPAWPDLLDRRG